MMTKTRVLILSIFVLLAISDDPDVHAQSVAPCPPSLSLDGDPSLSQDTDCGTTTSSFLDTEFFDTEYGPMQISGGVCPNIPTDAADHVVSTEAELMTALSALDGAGGIIVIENGTYSWGSVGVSASGADEDSRIYIRSETLHGAMINDGAWTISGSFVTISGFTRPATARGFTVEETADNFRLACSQINGGPISGNYLQSNSTNTAAPDDVEIDNNKFEDFDLTSISSILKILECNTQSESCVTVPKRWHIHHNYASAVSGNEGRFFYPGFGRLPLQGSDPSNPSGISKDAQDFMFENNHVKWNNKDWEDIKASRGIFRFNCFEEGTRLIHTRMGFPHLIYGNWWKDPGATQGYMAGWGHIIAFNYFGGSAPMVRIRSGQDDENQSLWAYYSASDMRVERNVCDGCNTFIDHLSLHPGSGLPLLADAAHKPLPVGNTFANNVIRNTGSVVQYSPPSDGHTSFSTFNSDNPNYNPASTPGGEKSNSVACFTDGHVAGEGSSVAGSSSLSTFGGRVDYSSTIPAPSWWN